MKSLIAVTLSFLIASAAMATDVMTCEKNSDQKQAAEKLLQQFKSGQKIAGSEAFGVEIADVTIANVGDARCHQNWAYTTLNLPTQNTMNFTTCGVAIRFASEVELEKFAKYALMLNQASESTVMITVKSAFSSRDPHDPHGSEKVISRAVPFCAILAE